MHDPLGGLERIKQFYLSYIETAFRIDDPEVSRARRELLESYGTLALDPVLEMVPRYVQWDERLEALAGDVGERLLPGFTPADRLAFVELALSGLFASDRADGPIRYASRFRPYAHQVEMLTRGVADGTPGIVTSGTGSGKTESFMLPLLAQIVREASSWPDGIPVGSNWYERRNADFVPQRQGEPFGRPKALRALILYPMNALVEDQMTRLRKALDSKAARETMDLRLRGNRIFFARYTGKTPVTGFEAHPRLAGDEAWRNRHARRLNDLRVELGEIARIQESACLDDAKRMCADPSAEPNRFLFPSVGGNELVDRWDIQATPPDILVTNYSMLNAILLREVDAPIMDKTHAWLTGGDEARFHLVMDELHLVRGSGGAETAGLLRILFQRLGLDLPEHRHKLRILASSASLPLNDGERGEASLRYLRDMFGSAGTHVAGVSAATVDLEAWRDAIVSGTAVPRDVPAGTPDRATMQAVARTTGSDAASPASGVALRRAVDALAGGRSEAEGSVEAAVRQAASLLAAACGDGPMHLSQVSERIFGATDLEALQGLAIVRALPDFWSVAFPGAGRPSQNVLNDVPSFRVHAFFRSIEGLFASVRPGEDAPAWGRPSIDRGEAFDTELHEGEKLRRFEMLYCESCGELFLGGRRGGRQAGTVVSILPAPQDLERLPESASSGRFEEASFEGYALFWPTTVMPIKDDPSYNWREAALDPRSGTVGGTLKAGLVPGFLLERRMSKDGRDKHDRRAGSPSTAVPYCCPSCGTDYSPRFRAANSQRREGRLSPIRSFRTGFGKTSQLLASELAAFLKAQGGDGKLVAFSDSRQDAANLALNIEEQHQRDLRRELLAGSVDAFLAAEKSDPGELAALVEHQRVAASNEDYETVARLQPRIRDLKRRLAEVNHQPSVPLSALLEFENGLPADGSLRPVLDRLVALGTNPLDGADVGRLGGLAWHEQFVEADGQRRWRVGRNEEERGSVRDARDQIMEEQRPDATDLMFSRTYFAFEEAGLGWPSFFGPGEYGVDQSRKDAWLRVFADAYRILPNRYMKEQDARSWRHLRDARGRVAHLVRQLCVQPEEEFGQFLHWLATDGRGHLEGRIDVAQLCLRVAQENDPFWRCGRCSRVHLHRGFEHCTRCGSDLAEAATGIVSRLQSQNFLGARLVRSRKGGEKPFRLRCEELTAQTLDPGERLRRFKGIFVRGQDEAPAAYALRRKASEIDLVSVTTTMEVGVDIGALQAVYQANMPPQRFNYQQRVGRAGRRGQAFAAVVTVCRSRSHDIHYFRNPLRITGDLPPPPFLTTGLEDIPSRLLRKFWLVAAFGLLRDQAGEDWVGDQVVPLDIHGEFVRCSEFFDRGKRWSDDLAAALRKTDQARRRTADVLSEASQVPLEKLLSMVEADSLLRELEELREEYGDRRIGLASALAERGLFPLYGMPTRTRNLYVGLSSRLRGNANQPEWDVIDREQDIAIHEFAPGAVLVRDKRRHLCIGFTGELPPPSSNPTENEVSPYGGWARERFGLGLCEACGNWEKDSAMQRACTSCGLPIAPEAYKPCLSPAGYRTDFRPTDADRLSTGRQDMTVASVGRLGLGNQSGNLRILFEERSEIHKINPGPYGPDGESQGFTVEERRDRHAGKWWPKGRQGRSRSINVPGQAVASGLVADDPGRWAATPDADDEETGWLASSKVTNALHITPLYVSPLLRITQVDTVASADRRDKELTSVRASAISATQVLLLRAALDLDVAPEEFEALAPRSQGLGPDARPFLQIADSLVNGSGFCRHLQVEGEHFVGRTIQSILDEPGDWPGSAVLLDDHPSACDQACYRCLQRYGNRSLHGLLDWRLGLAYLRAMLHPDFACGLDGDFTSFAELRDWKELANRYAALVEAYLPRTIRRTVGRLNLPAFSLDAHATKWATVVHPLWRREGLTSVLEVGDDTVFIDTFELARRPLSAIDRARN